MLSSPIFTLRLLWIPSKSWYFIERILIYIWTTENYTDLDLKVDNLSLVFYSSSKFCPLIKISFQLLYEFCIIFVDRAKRDKCPFNQKCSMFDNTRLAPSLTSIFRFTFVKDYQALSVSMLSFHRMIVPCRISPRLALRAAFYPLPEQSTAWFKQGLF